ncbi:hypothetical protein [Phycicoccus sp. 3266]|uniref:hypothetical protein n=1 Tax=Phycicoccus sp. 3266 TaxID=2817751 RepID=UPI00285AF715|nr:hypothetical protein [Phycicoccus sp. 3266]MDR6861953.1 putative RNA-binding Zn-ribbon protein involved in translation (DUF1610 family) [Phycicoccus sp. 3266]
MTLHACAICTRPAGDAFVCRDCGRKTISRLRLVADLCRYADDKRARFGSTWRAGTIGRTPEQPLPYDPRVTVVVGSVGRTLRAARDHVRKSGSEGPVYATDHPAALASWLTSKVDVLRHHPRGPAMIERLNASAKQLVKLFDAPPERLYVGPCGHDGCDASLYADRENGASVVACPKCKHETPISERRDELAAGVEAYLGTVKEISRLLRETFGDDVSERMIRGLIDHGLVMARGTRREIDHAGHHHTVTLLRIGEVREAVNVMHRDKAIRRAVKRHTRTATA